MREHVHQTMSVRQSSLLSSRETPTHDVLRATIEHHWKQKTSVGQDGRLMLE